MLKFKGITAWPRYKNVVVLEDNVHQYPLQTVAYNNFRVMYGWPIPIFGVVLLLLYPTLSKQWHFYYICYAKRARVIHLKPCLSYFINNDGIYHRHLFKILFMMSLVYILIFFDHTPLSWSKVTSLIACSVFAPMLGSVIGQYCGETAWLSDRRYVTSVKLTNPTSRQSQTAYVR